MSFRPENILELGMWDGGSLAFWFEQCKPRKIVGIDLKKRDDSPSFQKFAADKSDLIKTYWGINQGDSERLREIVRVEFSAPLDLVVDDASHIYEPTLASFETLFPLLRPGGLYVIEDWAWEHWKTG